MFRNCETDACLSNDCHGDDLMTPPAVLLQISMGEAEKATDSNEVCVLLLDFCPCPQVIT